MTKTTSSVPLPVWYAIAVASLALGLGGCGQKNAETTTAQTAATTQPESSAVTTTTDAPAASAEGFPAGTVLGDLGLPVYPTPKDNIIVNPPETNAAGEKSESVSMDPHDPIDKVVAWYKARMPSGSAQESADPNHASFQVGTEGDKIIRMVVIDHINGHVQTEIILMRKTIP